MEYLTKGQLKEYESMAKGQTIDVHKSNVDEDFWAYLLGRVNIIDEYYINNDDKASTITSVSIKVDSLTISDL